MRALNSTRWIRDSSTGRKIRLWITGFAVEEVVAEEHIHEVAKKADSFGPTRKACKRAAFHASSKRQRSSVC